jgi:protein-disulfide isomerase
LVRSKFENLNIHFKASEIMKKYLLAIPAAITIIIIIYTFYLHQNNPDNNSVSSSFQTLTENGSPILGNPNARITIVEFGDYQCTYCHAFYQNTKDQLIQEYVDAGKVNFIFRDFPLNGPDSVLAAQATYCANDQGKFWQYHDELYNNWGGERTGWVNQMSLDKFAIDIGLDLNEFDKCLADKKYESKVLDNQKYGEGIGVDSTPTFIIFTDKKITKIVGAQPFSVFQQVLDSI